MPVSARFLHRLTLAVAAAAPVPALLIQPLPLVPRWRPAQETAVLALLAVGAAAALLSAIFHWRARDRRQPRAWLHVAGRFALVAAWVLLAFVVVAGRSFAEGVNDGEVVQTLEIEDRGLTVFVVRETGLGDSSRTYLRYVRRGSSFVEPLGTVPFRIERATRRGDRIEFQSTSGREGSFPLP
jgi:hypothetical protein